MQRASWQAYHHHGSRLCQLTPQPRPPTVPLPQANRHADALVIASVVGGEAWDTARKAYMTAHPRPFMRMLHAVLGGEWAG